MFKVGDRKRATSTTTGIGTYTLDPAPPGFEALSTLGHQTYTTAWVSNDVDFEVGIYRVLTGPDRLERTHILESSNADAEVNWPASGDPKIATKKIRCGLPAGFAFSRTQTVSVAGGAGTQQLTQLNMRCDILILTGVLTGNRVAEVDDTPWKWAAVINQTTGNFTLNFKSGAGASQVEVYQGRAIGVAHDGVTMYKTAEDTPPGTYEDYDGTTVQPGRLVCDGSNQPIATYPALHNKIGFTHGNPGGGNFTLPDSRRRVLMGSGGTAVSGPANTVGSVGGAEVDTAPLPVHAHGVNDPGHGHGASFTAYQFDPHGSPGPLPAYVTPVANPIGFGVSVSGAGTGISIQNAGSGGTHNTVQPSLVALRTIRF